MRLYVGIGTKFKLNERFFEIVEELERNLFLAKDLDYETVKQKFSLTELYKYLEAGTLQFRNGKENEESVKYDYEDFSMLPWEQREGAKYKHFVIKPLLQVSGEKLKPFIEERQKKLSEQGYKVSVRSIYRWLSDFLKSDGDIRSLVNNTHNSGPKEKLIQGEVDLIIDEVMDSLYKRRELANAKRVFYGVIHRIDTENQTRNQEDKLKSPSISTIRRRINDSDSYERDKVRLGHVEARKKHGSVQMLKKPTYPLQRVEIDHTPLDLILIDKNGLPLRRPNVTLAIDKFTGYPLGVYVGFEPASYTSVMYCLLHAFAPKTYLKERFPSVQNEWLAYGIPELLVTDRGKEFKSKHLSEASLQLDFELDHNPARKPWYKGSIERYFRTLNEGLVHQLPGTTFSNVFKKGDYNPEKNAVMMLEDFLEHLHIFIVDIYAQEQRGIRLSPARMWEKAVENGFSPAIPSSKLDWKVALMKLGKGSIQNTGIKKDHMHYQSKNLQELKIRLGIKGKGNIIKYKYDPSDISKIYVYDELEMQYIETLCTDQEYSLHLNEYSHKLFVAAANEESKNNVSISSIAAARAKSEELVKNQILSKKERSILARMSNDGSNTLLNNDKVNALDSKPEEEPEKPKKTQKEPVVQPVKTEYYENDTLDLDEDWGASYD
ncbi:DDE-type integrase/transposase/recombinase [Neobacillus novalis]|uniref:DDE-type integrase/transposase/recombinase n=1 Tax=Neobacillus novalis TaxID=220687 RepID=A0AA95MJE0_9BACI|nr:Mu transposase C-terminal domain-containing protein [Neobacillus novalis]WHY84680.1 DDE-type integrase/transposase/recombinase [Neobacillus novalis]